MKWCRRNTAELVVETADTDPAGKYHPDFIWYSCPDNVEQGMFFDGVDYLPPVALPPTSNENSTLARSLAQQGQVIWDQDDRRRSVGSTPIIPDSSKADWDNWMRSIFLAQEKGTPPPAIPVAVRRYMHVPTEREAQCRVLWLEVAAGLWGVSAVFQENMLGKDPAAPVADVVVKVYDAASVLLYEVALGKVPYPRVSAGSSDQALGLASKATLGIEIIVDGIVTTEIMVMPVDGEVNVNIRW